MPAPVAGGFPPEQQFQLALQGSEIADALINLSEVLARELTNSLARRSAVAGELQELLYIFEAHPEALRPADEA